MPAHLSNAVRKEIVQFYNFDAGRSKNIVFKHFKKRKISKTTIYRLLKQYDEQGNIEVSRNFGKGIRNKNPMFVAKVKKIVERKPDISVRQIARKLKISKSYVHEIIKKDLNLKVFKKKVVPKYIKDQKQRAKKNCLKIYRKLIPSGSGLKLVIDDESYFMYDPSAAGGNKYYHSTSPDSVPVEYRIKPKEKFARKVMVWHAMDEDGNVSKPVFFEGTVNGRIYLQQCIKRVLIPFILQHHRKEDILFWPDMATSHYTKEVIEYLRDQKICFIPKLENAPNVPQARGIEKFWGIMKCKYSYEKNEPKNLAQFRRIYRRLLKSVTEETVQNVMKTARSNLRKIGLKGVYYSI